MAFELFKPRRSIQRLPEKSVSITKTGLTFSKDLGKGIKTDYIQVYLDYDKKRVGLKPVKKGTLNAYKLQTMKGTTTSYYLSIPKVSALIRRKVYSVEKTPTMLVFNVPNIKQYEK